MCRKRNNDIYKLNFDSNLPDDLYGEFQFVYDGLQNVMRSESDEVQVNVTKKTYKLIKSTKQLITNPIYNDAVIKLDLLWNGLSRLYILLQSRKDDFRRYKATLF